MATAKDETKVDEAKPARRSSSQEPENRETYGRDANVDTPAGNKVPGPDGPAGDGGATPRSDPDHQYQFPPNPEPSDSAREKAEENAKLNEELHGPPPPGQAKS